MNRQWALAAASIVGTLVVALAVIRWLAPQLLGMPVAFQVVRASEEQPPFFEGVFRPEDYVPGDFIIPDPFASRARPLYPAESAHGPHDILGFRNRQIPNAPEIIVIGDSQTYGNNAVIEGNWPSQVAARLEIPPTALYSMAVGGWGAVQYLEMFSKALLFEPDTLIVTFYTGNDSIESFVSAYSDERWSPLRPDASLTLDDLPERGSGTWWATFPDGLRTAFTPAARLISNEDHPAVRAGYEIMAEAARRMGALARESGSRLVFTIVPTKELVYSARIESEAIEAPDEYRILVEAERRNLETLAEQLAAVPGATYVDVLAPLQQAAMATHLYPAFVTGHPIASGYGVIAEAVSRVVTRDADRIVAEAGDSRVLFDRAFTLQRGRQYTEAIGLYETVLKVRPDHPQAPFNLALALMRRSDTDRRRAIELFEDLYKTRPEYNEILYRLGELEDPRDDPDAAAGWYQRYLDGPGHEELRRKARRRLAELGAQ